MDNKERMCKEVGSTYNFVIQLDTSSQIDTSRHYGKNK